MIRRKDKVYLAFIAELKTQITNSRYQAAKLVNREILVLYHTIGRMINQKIKEADWGDKILAQISEDLQNGFEGVRGFSIRNLKNMRVFYEKYPNLKSSKSLVKSVGFKKNPIGQTVSAQLQKNNKKIIGQTVSAQFEKELEAVFFSLGFSHHLLLIKHCSDVNELYYYMSEAAGKNWTYRALEYHIESELYHRQGKLISNFDKTLPKNVREHALNAFKDEYLLNFLNINEDDNEQVLEEAIITNIQKFLMSLGSDFTFVGRQYRLFIGGKEFFIDLLFYNRRLRAMVALELKTTEFDPRHAGQMDFYLSVIDDMLKLPDETPTIGIILCKEKNKTIVEYSLRNKKNPIGVAKYSYSQLPEEYQNVLPTPKELSKFLK